LFLWTAVPRPGQSRYAVVAGPQGNPPSGKVIVPVRIAPWSIIRPLTLRIYRNNDALLKPNQRVNLQALHSAMIQLLERLDIVDFGLDVETNIAQEVYEILENLRTDLGKQSGI
jgi:hypothetical protein